MNPRLQETAHYNLDKVLSYYLNYTISEQPDELRPQYRFNNSTSRNT
jgi:hypothetical protein